MLVGGEKERGGKGRDKGEEGEERRDAPKVRKYRSQNFSLHLANFLIELVVTQQNRSGKFHAKR
jgi:hypothetical protein